MSGCRFQSEPQHNPASVIRKLLTGSTLPCVVRSTVGQWGRRGMINLLACRIARDTFTSRHPSRVPESRPLAPSYHESTITGRGKDAR